MTVVGHSNQFAEKRYSISESQLNGIITRAFAKGYRSRYDDEEEERQARRQARKGYGLQDSHRGLGRSLVLGGLEGALGAYGTKDQVDEDYRKGLSEEDIISNAGRSGRNKGALIGGVTGAAAGGGLGYLLGKSANMGGDELIEMLNGKETAESKFLKNLSPKKAALLGAGVLGTGVALRGGLGGYFGAKKNARERLDLPRVERRSR